MPDATSHPPAYPRIRRQLHWLLAILLIGMIASGFVMTDLGWADPETAKITNQLYFWHKWCGFVVLILAVLRLLAAWAWRGPALPDHVSAAEKFIAFGVHTVLYGLMVLVPLLGWAAASAGGLLPQPPLFDTLEIPPLMPKQDESVTEFLFDMHKLAAMGLAGLASLHMLAALSHLIRADGVFSRIWGHE